MKKLIIINIVLLVLFKYLPEIKTNTTVLKNNIIEEPISTTEVVEVESIETIEQPQVEKNINVTSRSMQEVRESQEYIKPTKYSDELVEFIKQKEGFHSIAYRNSGELYWTIGYGHYGSDIYEGQSISLESANRLLIAELDGTCAYVLKYCNYLEFNQSQLDALVSFAFNCGNGTLQKLTANKTRNIEEIANHITSYTNGGLKGLVIRRQEEKEMLLKGE